MGAFDPPPVCTCRLMYPCSKGTASSLAPPLEGTASSEACLRAGCSSSLLLGAPPALCCRGNLIDDAMVAPCGHSFGGAALRRVVDNVRTCTPRLHQILLAAPSLVAEHTTAPDPFDSSCLGRPLVMLPSDGVLDNRPTAFLSLGALGGRCCACTARSLWRKWTSCPT